MKTPLPFVVSFLLSLPLAGCGGGGGSTPQPPTPITLKAVTNLNDSGAGSLREAIADAQPNEWIVFDTNLATGTINLLSPLQIDKHVTIGGLSSTFERFRISGQGNVRIFEMQAGASLDLRDLELQDGHANHGGAIQGDNVDVELTRVLFVSNHADFGGGAVRVTDGNLWMTECAFTANTAGWGGAVFVTNMDVTIDRSSFYLNSANADGGGALSIVSSNARIQNSTFDTNSSLDPLEGYGGAIALVGAVVPTEGAFLVMRSCTISNNTAVTEGGGIALRTFGSPCELDMSQSIVATNTAPAGQDIDAQFGAGSTGQNNVIGIGGADYWNAVDNNLVGDAVTPVQPLLLAVSFAPGGRAIRVPHMLSPAINYVPAGEGQNIDGLMLTVDERGQPRLPAGTTDAGAIEE